MSLLARILSKIGGGKPGTCRHRAVTPNSLRGIRPSSWPTGDGRMHVDGHCEDCSAEVWRHVRDDNEPPWQLQSVPCGCSQAATEASA
jgi:hypothetical protein